MFCAPGLIFDDNGGVGSRFHILSSQTHFRRYRGRRVSFSCFALPDSCSAVPRASGPVFICYTLELVFGGTVCVRSLFHVLRFRTHFRRYQGRRVLISSFALPDSFSSVPRATSPIFMFFAPGVVFGGTGSSFHFFRSRTHFRRYRERRVLFSCFVIPNSFSALSRATVPFSCFALLDSFRQYRGRCDPFSCFELPDSFSAVPRAPVSFSCFVLPVSFSTVPGALSLVFIFYARELVLGGTVGVGFCFHVLRSRTRFLRYRGVRSSFHVLRSRTRFRR
jgi:hypothetical protein